MPSYSQYLRYNYYNKILDPCWYDELKKKLDLLEINKIKINISELNIYLYQRYLYENGHKTEFDDTKYDIKNFMQIIKFKKIDYPCSNKCGYDADIDDEIFNKKNNDMFILKMNELSDKLAKFTIK